MCISEYFIFLMYTFFMFYIFILDKDPSKTSFAEKVMKKSILKLLFVVEELWVLSYHYIM